MNKKLTIALSILGILIFCIIFRFFVTKNAEKMQAVSIQKSMIPKVEISEPFDIETSSIIEAPGRLTAVQSADVIARVQGMILKQHYKDGDIVRKGQVLYTIDPSEFQIGVERAKANLESAKAQQFQARKDYERAKELVENDYIAKSNYDQALSAKDTANANVRAAQAALNDARRLLSYTTITAPISGKISLPVVTVGNFLSSPNTVLTKIVSIDPIYATYSLDSGMYSKLKDDEILPKTGQKKPIKVEIKLPDGTVYNQSGNADFSDNVISETTGSITLRATFPNPKALLIPGDFVNVKVYSNKKITRLAVPQRAVLQDTEGRYLFVVDNENVAHKRKIETDGQNGDNWLVTSGIKKGEKFVSDGVIGVRDGVKVEIISNLDQGQTGLDAKTENKESAEDIEVKVKASLD